MDFSLSSFSRTTTNISSKNNKFFSYNVILLHTKKREITRNIETCLRCYDSCNFWSESARQYVLTTVHKRIARLHNLRKNEIFAIDFHNSMCKSIHFTVSVHSPKEIDNINEKCSSCQQLNSINTTRDL